MKRSVCIISFSPIARDARVLRQIEYLAPLYDVTAVGFGARPELWAEGPHIHWCPLPQREQQLARRLASRLIHSSLPVLRLLCAPAALRHRACEAWYWSGPYQRAALVAAMEARCDAYHANDWTALPVAAEAARRHGARLVFDAHEYAPLEFENRRLWDLRYRPTIVHFLHKYASQVDAFTTVCEPIGQRYQEEFGLMPTIVHNAPKRIDSPARHIDPSAIRLVHHGAAFRDRGLEKMILALVACDPRFSLHFILVPGHPRYIEELETLARQVAPGRVVFHPPVPPEQTAQAVAQYDMGFCLIEPRNYNYLMAAPNKFFDYIAAGMPVCIGPSPAMAEIVEGYGLGCVAPSFNPQEVAATLNAVDGPRLATMQHGARRAADFFHADAEMAKVVALYRLLLTRDTEQDPAACDLSGTRGHRVVSPTPVV